MNDHECFDDDLVHRVTITAEIPSGPGIEIVAAELLLDLVQRFGYQAIGPNSVRLDITTHTRALRTR
ncbi:MAG: hypothetical protein ABR540_19225 [Acidimicrobiales bacterium]